MQRLSRKLAPRSSNDAEKSSASRNRSAKVRAIGWALLQAAQGRAQEQSSSPLWLAVNSKNARALAFYARQGYNKVGITYFVLGDGRHENHVLVGGGAH